MAGNTSFGRRGPTQVGTGARAAHNPRTQANPAASTPVDETLLDRLVRLPWRWTAFGVIMCLLAVFLTQPEPLKSTAKWVALAIGVAAGVLNTRLAKEATLKRAREALDSVPRT